MDYLYTVKQMRRRGRLCHRSSRTSEKRSRDNMSNMPEASQREGEHGVGESSAHTSGVSSTVAAKSNPEAAARGAHHAVPESADSIPLPKSTGSTPEPKRGRLEFSEPTLAEMQDNIVKLITQHVDQKNNSVNEKIDYMLQVTTENKKKN